MASDDADPVVLNVVPSAASFSRLLRKQLAASTSLSPKKAGLTAAEVVAAAVEDGDVDGD